MPELFHSVSKHPLKSSSRSNIEHIVYALGAIYDEETKTGFESRMKQSETMIKTKEKSSKWSDTKDKNKEHAVWKQVRRSSLTQKQNKSKESKEEENK